MRTAPAKRAGPAVPAIPGLLPQEKYDNPSALCGLSWPRVKLIVNKKFLLLPWGVGHFGNLRGIERGAVAMGRHRAEAKAGPLPYKTPCVWTFSVASFAPKREGLASPRRAPSVGRDVIGPGAAQPAASEAPGWRRPGTVVGREPTGK